MAGKRRSRQRRGEDGGRAKAAGSRSLVRALPIAIFLVGLVTLGVALAVRFGAGRLGDRSPEFDGARAESVVASLLGEGGRHPGAEDREAWVARLLELLAPHVDHTAVQRFGVVETEGDRFELANVIGRLNPDATTRVLVAAHWDTRRWSDLDPDPDRRDEPTPGANDNASGVAVVVELARALREASFEAFGVDFVLFDGRELGREGSGDASMGARYFASHLPAIYPTARPTFAIVLDTVGGCDHRFRPEESAERAAPEVYARVVRAAAALGHAERFATGPAVAMPHDHTALLRTEVPTTLLMDYDYALRHTVADTAERVCAESLERVGDVLVGVLLGEESDVRASSGDGASAR